MCIRDSPKPTSPGHIFKAWYAGNAPYDFDTPVTQNLHLEDWWNICNHSGSTEKSTCTAAAVCTVCGGTIRALKHLWGAWLPDSGAATHTRTCTRGVPHTAVSYTHLDVYKRQYQIHWRCPGCHWRR